MFWGYSLAYARDAGPFIGNMKNFGMINVLAAPSGSSPVLPEIVFCLYQLLFCACTVSLDACKLPWSELMLIHSSR